MNRLKTHFQRWNRWRRGNGNGKFHQLLVLLKLKRSISWEQVKLGELFYEGFMKGVNSQLKEWPKEGFPVINVDTSGNGVKFTVDISDHLLL